MNEIVSLGARRLAAQIHSRRISAREALEAHLTWIERINTSVNAIVQLDIERATKRAHEIDGLLGKGFDIGPLAGVPFTAKDNLETAGVVTTVGVPERRHTVPERDATVVRRLKEAGGILLGKTNCPPWGGGLETDNEVYGRTSNPYDLDRTPGGSSGGEAAAIASGMSACGLGSDSGGSVRYPAHCCGIAAIKPTAGLVPVTGMLDDVGQIGALRDPRTQIGTMARSVDDVALLLRVIAGPDGVDAGCFPVQIGDPAKIELRGLRVAIQRDNCEIPPAEETIDAVNAAAQALRDSGMSTRNADLPDEGYGLTRDIWRSYGGEMPTCEYYRILDRWDRYRGELLHWFQDFDLILRPVDARPAPRHGETSDGTLYTIPFSLTGWPCVTVRCGISPEGLPVGAQIVAHPWRDDVALAAARRLEEALGGWTAPELPHADFP